MILLEIPCYILSRDEYFITEKLILMNVWKNTYYSGVFYPASLFTTHGYASQFNWKKHLWDLKVLDR